MLTVKLHSFPESTLPPTDLEVTVNFTIPGTLLPRRMTMNQNDLGGIR